MCVLSDEISKEWYFLSEIIKAYYIQWKYICSHKEKEKRCTLLMFTSVLPSVQKHQTIELAAWIKMCPCPPTGTQVWRGMAIYSSFLPGATVLCTPCRSPTICLFRADNPILSQKYTVLFLPCLAASAKHWGSSRNECICASHKFLKEKVMQIFHFHSSRI